MEAQLHDKRLANITITEVRVTNDLQARQSILDPSLVMKATKMANASVPSRR